MATDGALELSVVVPARDERENLAPLLEQTRRALVAAGIRGELIVVDDGSSDGTFAELLRLAGEQDFLRPLRLAEGRGQSAAIAAGIAAARGRWIATLDGDLQNDPADLPGLLEMARQGGFDMVQGVRASRRDSFPKRAGSRVAGWTRRLLLGDRTLDTGCATRVVTAVLARTFPLQFRGMHRFLPLYARRTGARVVETPVSHRPRLTGNSKYGLLDRHFSGLVDCFAVRWMLRRYRSPVPAPPGDVGSALPAGGGTTTNSSSSAAPPVEE